MMAVMGAGARILAGGFDAVREVVHTTLDGVAEETLTRRLDADANSLGWLVWHLTRVQDDMVCAALGLEQLWVAGGWDARFGMAGDLTTGEGHTSIEVARVHADAATLLAYHDAVHARTSAALEAVDDARLDEPLAVAGGPATTVGAYLLGALGGDLQHAGQAAFVRGILDRER